MKNLISKEEKDQIDLICKQYRIKNYSINPDASIDVDGSMLFVRWKLEKLPLQFGTVSDNFCCDTNQLSTLEGAPQSVGYNFHCYRNNLTSLVGGPSSVGGNYQCYNNQLSTLEGAPHTIGGNLICAYNKLTSTYAGDVDIEVNGFVNMSICNNLPQLLQDNIVHIKLILKYQRHFEIWNDDLTLNEENFQVLITEIEDGLE